MMDIVLQWNADLPAEEQLKRNLHTRRISSKAHFIDSNNHRWSVEADPHLYRFISPATHRTAEDYAYYFANLTPNSRIDRHDLEALWNLLHFKGHDVKFWGKFHEVFEKFTHKQLSYLIQVSRAYYKQSHQLDRNNLVDTDLKCLHEWFLINLHHHSINLFCTTRNSSDKTHLESPEQLIRKYPIFVRNFSQYVLTLQWGLVNHLYLSLDTKYIDAKATSMHAPVSSSPSQAAGSSTLSPSDLTPSHLTPSAPTHTRDRNLDQTATSIRNLDRTPSYSQSHVSRPMAHSI
jgi:hypothetical protein